MQLTGYDHTSLSDGKYLDSKTFLSTFVYTVTVNDSQTVILIGGKHYKKLELFVLRITAVVRSTSTC